MKLTCVKGMHDILPSDAPLWQHLEHVAHQIFQKFGFVELRTPMLEKLPLFVRGVGTGSDIVQKEMYHFIDQGGEELALRPEGTAALVRAFIEHGLYQNDSTGKYFYMGPMFRRERPQKGRFRQFHQIGVELLGPAHPYADAEVMHMAMDLFAKLGIEDLRLEINSLGCTACRPQYHDSLTAFLAKVEGQLCEECQRRLHTNPQRIFDCKELDCQRALADAPSIQDFWCAACTDHFQSVCEGLDQFGVTYWCNHRIARGLDYYMRTAFEVISHNLGAQSSLCGGGRYDGLVQSLGGPDVPGVGFAIGMERLLMLLEAQRETLVQSSTKRVFIAALGAAARQRMIPLLTPLRTAGWRVEWDYDDRSLKSQLRRADRDGFAHVVLIGEDEVARGVATVRNMQTKEQATVNLDGLVEHLAGLHAPKAA